MLIYLYIFALILGGVLLGASVLLGGHGDSDVDADGDAGLDTDADAGADAGADAHGLDKDLDVGGGASDFFWAFRSMRFWTFFSAFFGLTGLVLQGLGLVGSVWLAFGLAVGVGALTGLGAAATIRWLSKDESGSAAGANDYLGKNVRVMLPVEKGKTGRVRLQLKGSTVDVPAVTDEEQPFDRREEAMIIEMEGHTARIARVDASADEPPRD